MAWLSNNSFATSDKLHNVDLNNLANDIRNWGGDVNGGGFNLYNCTISGVFTDPTTTVGDLIVHGPTAGTVGALQRLPIGTTDGLALVIDHTQTLGVKWGVAAQGMLDPTTTKGDLIVKPSGAAPTRLPIGADSHILICDSSQTTGLRWGTITGFAAPGSDKQVMVNQAGVPGASANFVFDYSKGHLLVGGGTDDGTAAVVQITGLTHTTLLVRSDQFFSSRGTSNLYAPPDAGYGGIGYQGGAIYWFWNGAAYLPVDFSKLSSILADPTTTLGDLIVRGSAGVTRFGVGADSYMLVADSTQPLGLRWQPPPAIGVTSAFGRTGAVIAQAGDYTVSMVTNAVDATQSYVNPAWITSIPWSKITTAPTFLIDPTTAKGDLITRTVSATTRIVIGTDGQLLTADSTQSTGMKWASPSTTYVTTISPGALSGAVIFTAGANVSLSQITNSSGQQIAISVPNINSSTGMSDPTTSQGDLIVHGLTAGTARMPVGTTGQILTVDTTQDLGVKWAAPAAFVGVTSLSPGALTGAVTLLGGSNVLISQSGQSITIGVPNVMVDPMTTKGDLVVHGTATTRLPVGADGLALVADSTQTLGVKWGSVAGSQTPWLTDIDAATHNLNNVGIITSTSTAYNSIQSSGGIDVQGTIRSTRQVVPPSGQGTELLFGGGVGYLSSYDRGAGAALPLYVSGSYLVLNNSGGKVGIGTTAPAEVLDVAGHLRLRYVTGLGAGTWLDNSTTAEQCFVGMNATTNTWRVYSALSGVGYNRFAVNLDPAVGGSVLVTADAAAMTGSMGLAQLTIQGSPATGNNNKSLWVGFDTTNNVGVIQAGIAGTGYNNLLLNPTGGEVGIGLTSPAYPLDVAGAIHASGIIWTPLLHIKGSYCSQVLEDPSGTLTAGGLWRFSTGGSGNSLALQLNTAAAGDFSTGPSMMSFTGTGNCAIGSIVSWAGNGYVGIGTGGTAPAAQLQVYGAGTTNVTYTNGDAIGGCVLVTDYGTAVNNGGQVLFGSGYGVSAMVKMALENATGPAGDLIFGTRASSGNVVERMRVANTGNIGIGSASPDRPLTFAATVGDKLSLYPGQMWGLGLQASLLQIIASVVGGDIAFGYGTSASFTEVMRIKGSGFVGIGKASPAYNLDVVGDCNITGAFRVNGVAISTGAAGVSSITANAPITASASTGAVTLGYTGISSLATNTATNLGLSGSTGAVTLNFLGVTVYMNGSSVATATRPALNFAAGINMTVSGSDGGSQTNVTYAYTSDRILKRNIRDLEGGLSIVNRLRPVSFEWNGLGGMKEGQRASGVVAQELKETLPDSVYPFDVRLRPGDAENSEILAYDPNQILFHAVLALQQVDKRLSELEAIIKGQKL